ncbi:hypothetical protein KP509_02G103400 [Ceratopteris richardii]|uniref:Uncharacterized protein n=1 Tax=Ceratopteris richardii TaxID=49495 RepID=A0A8T2VG92_CERRI|nr:hypothetical protein KP509_02G103400 [Ceratopteris richardii]
MASVEAPTTQGPETPSARASVKPASEDVTATTKASVKLDEGGVSPPPRTSVKPAAETRASVKPASEDVAPATSGDVKLDEGPVSPPPRASVKAAAEARASVKPASEVVAPATSADVKLDEGAVSPPPRTSVKPAVKPASEVVAPATSADVKLDEGAVSPPPRTSVKPAVKPASEVVAPATSADVKLDEGAVSPPPRTSVKPAVKPASEVVAPATSADVKLDEGAVSPPPRTSVKPAAEARASVKPASEVVAPATRVSVKLDEGAVSSPPRTSVKPSAEARASVKPVSAPASSNGDPSSVPSAADAAKETSHVAFSTRTSVKPAGGTTIADQVNLAADAAPPGVAAAVVNVAEVPLAAPRISAAYGVSATDALTTRASSAAIGPSLKTPPPSPADNTHVVDEAEAEVQRLKALPIRPYLEATVVPLLLEGLQRLVLDRPSDPVGYLASYMFQHNPYQNDSRPASARTSSAVNLQSAYPAALDPLVAVQVRASMAKAPPHAYTPVEVQRASMMGGGNVPAGATAERVRMSTAQLAAETPAGGATSGAATLPRSSVAGVTPNTNPSPDIAPLASTTRPSASAAPVTTPRASANAVSATMPRPSANAALATTPKASVQC